MKKIYNWLRSFFTSEQKYYFECSLIFFNVLSKNGHIYLSESVDLVELNKRAKNYLMVGEIGYPEGFDVTMSQVSHRFTNFFIRDNILFGQGHTLETKKGRELINLLKNEAIVFRPQAIGTVNPDQTLNLKRIFTFNAILKTVDAFAFVEKNYLTISKKK